MNSKTIRQAIDDRLQTMEWHGETSVWRSLRSSSRGRASHRVSVRLAAALCALTILACATALAARGLLFSPRQTASQQAHALMQSQYGFSEETLALFDETIAEDGGSWTITFTLPAYAEQAGAYTVRGGSGVARAEWSHDGAEVSPDAALSAPIWGPMQVERMRVLYHEHAEALAAAEAKGGYGSLSIEEKAAIDAPLLELPHVVGVIHVLPAADDITPEEALEEARGIYSLERGISAGAAAQVPAAVSLLSDGNESYYDVLFTEADGGSFRVLIGAASAVPDSGLRVGTLLRVEDGARLLYDKAEGVNAIPGPEEDPDVDAMTHAERAACAAEQIAAGGDPREWNYLLPGEGDIAEEEAVALAKEAISARLGLDQDALDAMTLETRFWLDYDLGEEPVRAWWVRFVDNINDYQVTLRAGDGRVESLDLMDGALGVG